MSQEHCEKIQGDSRYTQFTPQDALILHRALEGKAQVYSDGEKCGSITDFLQVQLSGRKLTLYTKK